MVGIFPQFIFPIFFHQTKKKKEIRVAVFTKITHWQLFDLRSRIFARLCGRLWSMQHDQCVLGNMTSIRSEAFPLVNDLTTFSWQFFSFLWPITHHALKIAFWFHHHRQLFDSVIKKADYSLLIFRLFLKGRCREIWPWKIITVIHCSGRKNSSQAQTIESFFS